MSKHFSTVLLSLAFTVIWSMTAHAGEESTRYYAAKAYDLKGAMHDRMHIHVQTDKTLVISISPESDKDTYKYMEVASKIIDRPVFQLGDNYIIEHQPGVLVWAVLPKGLGKSVWSKRGEYNILAKDRGYVRQLFTSADMQNDVKRSLVKYSRKVKKEVAKMQANSDTSLSMR